MIATTPKQMYQEIAQYIKKLDDRGDHYLAAVLARAAYFEWRERVITRTDDDGFITSEIENIK
jgi:hypothetical protein